MKIHSKALIAFIFLSFLISCKKDKNEEALIFDGQLTNNSACKYFSTKSTLELTADTLSKVEYVYNNTTHTLQLKHVNAGFNCCPGTLSSQFVLNGNTILITEQEEEAQCHCNCLYDLDFEISGIEQKTYNIRFIEPYAESMPKLEFEINLLEDTEGSFTVVRRTYPWGINSFN